ncbi:HAD hydrolase-like protein [Cellulomonas oligotrophica]|uniref:Hydrolase n=1 Tax=Cellulomonas oligotrophica TaxID=931536 RepID=A0A7Y9FJD8_9CELL|nr:HAD hydrolase-like protein [Cellulomonas oligotrophica]NYD88092.1 phosphoglycolate phosphatase [Cellulomonas oligotrophica]GIG33600.1 hydrolase [Cellulomonas oligotrophica]
MPSPAARPLALLDLDGTLMNSAPGVVHSVRVAYEHVGVPVPDEAAMLSFIGPPIGHSFPAHGVPAALVPAAVAAYQEHFGRVGVWDTTVFDGIPAALTALREAGVLLVVATAKPIAFAEPICAEVGLTPLLDAIVGAPLDESESKGQIIARALVVARELTGAPVDPARAVMLGDREHDVHGAAEHGIACLGASWGYGAPGELVAAGVAQVLGGTDEVAPAVLARVA